MCGVIYCITCLLTQMKYVGQTTQPLERRINQHKHRDQYIDRIIKEYGWENFTVEVLEECTSREQLNECEIFWIAELNCKASNGYNLTDGGEGMSGFSLSEETRAQMSLSRMGEKKLFFGKHHTKDARARISMARLGNKNTLGFRHTDESKARMAMAKIGEKNPFFGKHHTKESRNLMSVAKIGIPQSREQVVKSAAAQRADSSFKNILNAMAEQQLTYSSLAKLMGISRKSISRRMCGKIRFTESDIAKLVEIFGKPSEYLLERDDGLPTTFTNRGKTPYKNLLNEMEQHKLSYTELGEFLGLSQSTISNKMRGKIKFMEKDVAKLVEIFGKPAEYLMQRDD